MSKSIKKSFYKNLTYDKLLNAHFRASKLKNNKKEILQFNVDQETNIIKLIIELKNGTYKIGKYKTFIVHEPKERTIKCLPYRDRIVQQWYIYEFIKPYILPRLINSTCACIDKRGTHYAVNLVQKYMRQMKKEIPNYYIIKMDIKKYFDNIDRDILFSIMKKYISDKLLLNLTYNYIYEDNLKKSIPIGNYTSQYFANIYLDKLDQYIKKELKLKYYVRYMDDFIILSNNKNEARIIFNKIEKFLNNKLNLEINPKSKIYPSKLGVNFCGYRIYETHRLIRNRSKKNIHKKIKLWNELYKNNKINQSKFVITYNSIIGHLSHSNSYNLTQYINKNCLYISENEIIKYIIKTYK